MSLNDWTGWTHVWKDMQERPSKLGLICNWIYWRIFMPAMIIIFIWICIQKLIG